jgi:hypothetical protein
VGAAAPGMGAPSVSVIAMVIARKGLRSMECIGLFPVVV